MPKTCVWCFMLALIINLSQQQCPYKVIKTGVEDITKNEILNLHNDFRLQIARGNVSGQPKGTNLKRMYWDQSLADQAQKVANKCEFKHLIVQDNRWTHVGQNLFTYLSTADKNTKPDWYTAISEWFNEHKIYKYLSYFSHETGHYTQLVWAQTNYVGCGYIYFYKNDNIFFYQKLYVCNYGPGGNVYGEAPYSTEEKYHCHDLC